MKKVFILLLLVSFAFVSCADMNKGNQNTTYKLLGQALESAIEKSNKVDASRAIELMEELGLDPLTVESKINQAFENADKTVSIAIKGETKGSVDLTEGASASAWYEVVFRFKDFGFKETIDGEAYEAKLNGTLKLTFELNASISSESAKGKGEFVLKTALPILLDAKSPNNIIKGGVYFKLTAMAKLSEAGSGVKFTGRINGKNIDESAGKFEFDFSKLIKK